MLHPDVNRGRHSAHHILLPDMSVLRVTTSHDSRFVQDAREVTGKL